MILNDAELAALQLDVQNIGVFFQLQTDPVVRLWLGFGDIEPGINVLDVTGMTYQGFGAISDVPEFNQMINGAAARVDFTISGVSGDVLAIASGNDTIQVKGKLVAVGFGIFNFAWSLLGSVKWFASYTADYLAIQQAIVDDPTQPIVRAVTLSTGSLLTGRRRPSLSYFSAQDQQTRYPGDLFCNLTGRYAHGFQKPWPQFT